MYGFVSHTWNPIKGRCIHSCDYCYMKRWGKQKPVRLVESELRTNLGHDNFIFVGSSTDMFAQDIPDEWIKKVLAVCRKHPDNKYLFQSKNPQRFHSFEDLFPKDTILATTIETNRLGFAYNAPSVARRQYEIQQDKFPVMITIEPIMHFDLDILTSWLRHIEPFQVAIGADSKGSNLPEPSKEKVEALIKELKTFTKVFIKPNLSRITR